MDKNQLEKLLKSHNLSANGLAEVLVQSLEEQEALERLNRSYRALSETIRVRADSRSEPELLERIAKLLKEYCQYKYVWIGYKEDDPDQSIRPVAWSAETGDFIRQIKVSWGDGPLGQTGVGRAIGALKPVIFADILGNPGYAHWRESARRFGFHSVASFPLLIDRQPFGVLVLYSVAGESFHQEELKLLSEIAGELSAGVQLLREQTKREAAQAQLNKLHKAVEQSPVSIIVTNRDGIIEYVNPFFTSLTGFSAQEAIGKTPGILSSGKNSVAMTKNLWDKILSGHNWSGEFINRTKDGREFIEYAQIAPIFNDQGEITHFIAVKEDITRRKQLEEKLKRMAHYDQLTQLPNRALFYDRFKQALALAGRQQLFCALFFIDLNNFKQINDNFGHNTGDALLRACAERLTATVRKSDTVARIGGDEFVIISNLLQEPESATSLAEKVLEVLVRPFQIMGQRCEIGASIGISLYPTDGLDSSVLINKADQAMYRIKKQRLNAFSYYLDPEVSGG